MVKPVSGLILTGVVLLLTYTFDVIKFSEEL